MMMKKTFFAGIISIVLLVPSLLLAGIADTTQLKAKPVFGKEAKVVTYILDNNHYRKIILNDSLSSVILDSYIKNLDNNKTYFTSTDLAGFEKYRKTIDDMTRAENVTAAFDIYGAFRKRFVSRMDYIMNNLIHEKFDYTTEEFYETDRDKEQWCKNEQELNEVWRKIIKARR
jgi:carboxyl-terminal processing protease